MNAVIWAAVGVDVVAAAVAVYFACKARASAKRAAAAIRRRR